LNYKKRINAVGINPNKFVLDFEISMHQAINIIFPTAQIWDAVSIWAKLGTVKFKA